MDRRQQTGRRAILGAAVIWLGALTGCAGTASQTISVASSSFLREQRQESVHLRTSLLRAEEADSETDEDNSIFSISYFQKMLQADQKAIPEIPDEVTEHVYFEDEPITEENAEEEYDPLEEFRTGKVYRDSERGLILATGDLRMDGKVGYLKLLLICEENEEVHCRIRELEICMDSDYIESKRIETIDDDIEEYCGPDSVAVSCEDAVLHLGKFYCCDNRLFLDVMTEIREDGHLIYGTQAVEIKLDKLLG